MKTKFFRVATAGPTIDGREITAAQIDEMAETYNPQLYGARVWNEHLRSLGFGDTPFKAFGDVLALKADNDNEGNRVLLAQIDATPDLVKVKSDRQKVFWSIELNPDFRGSGKAYLDGLAMTDSPASVGTEILKFSLNHRDQLPDANRLGDKLYSESVEADFEEAEETPADDSGARIGAALLDLLGKAFGRRDAPPAENDGAVAPPANSAEPDRLADGLFGLARSFSSSMALADQRHAALRDEIAGVKADFSRLEEQLAATPAAPPADPHAGNGAAATDC